MAVILVTGFFASYPLAAVTAPMFGIILFLLIAIAGGITIYGLKSSKSASTKVPIKKYVAIIAIALALITPTVCGAYQSPMLQSNSTNQLSAAYLNLLQR